MSKIKPEQSAPRREFMKSALALSGMAAAASITGPSLVWGAANQIKHQSLDPVNPDILFGTTSSIWNQSIWLSGGGAPEDGLARPARC